MKKVLALALLLAAAIGLSPMIQQVHAYLFGQVDLSRTESAKYTATSTGSDQLIACSFAGMIRVSRNQGPTTAYFRCKSNYPASLPVSFQLVNGDGVVSAIEGSATLHPGDTALCRAVVLTAPATAQNNQTGTVTFRATSTGPTDFEVTVHFSGAVRAENGRVTDGGGCP